eukprot:422261_1
MLYAILLSICSFITILNASLDRDDIDRLRDLLIRKIDSFSEGSDDSKDKPLAGALVRMVFHDCAGTLRDEEDDGRVRGCNGCMNMDQIDHAGLRKKAVEPIAEIFREFSDKISIADFWAACGNVALEYTESLAPNGDKLPALPYFFGRKDCAMAPNARSKQDKTEFPMAHHGWDPLISFFRDSYGYGEASTTAILGAHSLGKCHREASGFDGAWTKEPSWFDNSFYKELADHGNGWDQVHTTANPFPQWSNKGKGGDLIMLNADVGLYMAMEDGDFIDPASGVVMCRMDSFGRFPKCKDEVSKTIVEDFARNNQIWLNEFVKAWNILVTHNQPKLLKVTANPFGGSSQPQPVPVPKPAPQSDGGNAPPTKLPRSEWAKETRCCDGFKCIREFGHQATPKFAYKTYEETERKDCCEICYDDDYCDSWTWDMEYLDCFLFAEAFQLEKAVECEECVSGRRVS